MSQLFQAYSLRGVSFKNRVVVSPMCQYSSEDGFANDWHLVHLGSRAVGGVGLIITEAAAVSAEGRISPQDLGIWKDEHVEMLARINRFVHQQGAHIGVQLAHAGRKASTYRPWADKSSAEKRAAVPESEGGWQVVAPSAIAFNADYPMPRALALDEMPRVVAEWRQAAVRAEAAGYDVIEIHAAHGYLLHEFMSPLSNQRNDAYGGSFDNRIRLTLEVVEAVRAVWDKPLFVRISATDWAEGGWDIDQSVELARRLKPLGVDLMDVSSGGLWAQARIPVAPLYQVPFAERIRHEAGMATGAVGLITTPEQADLIVSEGKADMVFLAREFLRQPYWTLNAAKALGDEVAWLPQYVRGKL
jgi:2,4-dienoyl-CoA reductase-like NADH-dependent reductase (Old Yellow Enzyme family)